MKLIGRLLSISVLIIVIFSNILYSDQLSAGTVAYWTFNEMSGTTLNDIGGNQNNGEVIGAQWAELEGESSLQFDGVDDYVQVVDNSTQDITMMTLEAIVYLNDASQGGIISKWGTGGLADSYVMYISGSYLYAKIVRDGIAGQTTVQSISTLALGQWIHVAATYDGASLKVYINHQLEGEVVAAGTIAQTDNDLLLGYESRYYTYLDGYIGQARISDGALDPSEFLSIITSVSENKGAKIPGRYVLIQNYPNPFNPRTVISWQLAVSSNVELSIYNLLGQKVTTLISEWLPAGYHTVEFDGQNLSSGVYLYQIEAGSWQDVRKMVLLR